MVVGNDVTVADATGEAEAVGDVEVALCEAPAGDAAEGTARAELPIAARTSSAAAIDSKRSSGFAHLFAAICRKKPSEARVSEFEARAVSGTRCVGIS
jgi:hypothetical protein